MTELEERDAFAAADVAFHFAVMDVAGDQLASGIARSLSKRAGESSRYYGAPGADAVRLTLEEHQRVYDAIEAGDSDAAAREMRDHIALAWERRRIRD
ncbi:FCD domain-containing protein [Pseudoclavibacter helvolus]|uniref:FCD domain-containing protein n=1 Tax=Pseudoclavibacter helvolus TaxID=255205 RepID=UPI000AF6925D|nr:FCD domain-containing protein [Pseudoclavibacter helvolus]